jgi:hypothetical protein
MFLVASTETIQAQLTLIATREDTIRIFTRATIIVIVRREFGTSR